MKNIKIKIYTKLIVLEIVVIVIMRFLIPVLSNYPPYSESPDFQVKIETISHDEQYILLGVFAIILQLFLTHFFFSDIFKYLKKDKKNVSKEETELVREKCFLIPKKLFIAQTLLLAVVLCMLFSMVQISIVLCIKFLLIYFSFFTASWVISTVLIKNDLNNIIESTYLINNIVTKPDKKSKFYINLINNLLPLFIFIMITISLLGYAKVTDQNGESKYSFYKNNISYLNLNNLSIDGVKKELSTLSLKDSSDYFFIITNDTNFFSNPSGSATSFFINYANDFLDKTNGRIYEYYGVEEEAYGKNITLSNGQTALIGFKYSTMNISIVYFYIATSILCTIIYVLVLFIWTKNISKNISQISDRLSKIAKNIDLHKDYTLPVFSNDEIADLTISFNEIQKVTKNNIRQIQNNQQMLLERERLASLGQLIGGIAHNLKTPIMSISGAAEGLDDLIKEYDSSIDDPEVNSCDHHDIAKDMSGWVLKIRDYTSYMSNIITAVKGQAVNLSNEDDINFTVNELLKSVDILMKHELKNALIYLKVSTNNNEELTLNGDINSLVQVINNMISNAIQAYNGIPEKNIYLNVEKTDKNVIISIKDEAGGLPQKVQDKLFKEMITTKGKNGTGLGLYISYSTIRGHFNGDITFDVINGKSTKFNIILPL